MTASRFPECLEVIGWTPLRVARILDCHENYILALLRGHEEVPVPLAGGLESLVLCQEAAVPADFYGRSAQIVNH